MHACRKLWELGRCPAGYMPSAYQIRYAGCKGMVTLQPSLVGKRCAGDAAFPPALPNLTALSGVISQHMLCMSADWLLTGTHEIVQLRNISIFTLQAC